ncbi:2,3-bisphosphoglycerate-dependent phosphoglycerate mutase [Methylacidimicrobium cyclopophantes]|uniref:2,3-bisphosphoglycerate-dependent phosphoglycerate mutase n=1 Tax=Methylacidimicrobium cyclopophantes TaxID=1041766 RepID=A0A5E6M5I4_9BACT|nr:histidine phosphatase family protein [Methylacidimicrobium cyclopophantes]VVM04578.1 2,3-bisphosphoglycerate-dependent phosphoglycerate mutase [Methylacidimicrobium cyclopophantes]
MNLYLVAHGSAVPNEKDPERPLSEAGIAECSRLAQLLRKWGVRVQGLVHSSKTRSRQSAQILLPAVYPGGRLTLWECLDPDDSPGRALRAIRKEKVDLLLVGHEPNLAKIATRLLVPKKIPPVLSLSPGSLLWLQRQRTEEGKAWRLLGMLRAESLRVWGGGG